MTIQHVKTLQKKFINGAFIDFLEQNDFKYYESTLVSAYLINYIKDITEKEKYINSLYMDTWSTVDSLKFNVKNQEKEFINLAKKYINNKDPFKRRVGVRILFSYTSSKYVDEVYNIIDGLKKEKEYYVNMCVAWLVCELMIKNKDKTIQYLSHHNLNDFTINKAISKCRESFRITQEDKDMLLKYKV